MIAGLLINGNDRECYLLLQLMMQLQHLLISKGRRVWEKVVVMNKSPGKAVGAGEDAQLQRKLS